MLMTNRWKTTRNILGGGGHISRCLAASGIGCVLLVVGSLQAQIPTSGPITISATIILQNVNVTDNGTTTSAPPPYTKKITNADILTVLAKDGLIPSPVPNGASLVMTHDQFALYLYTFQVVQKTSQGTNVWDVTGVFNLSFGDNDVWSGKQSDDGTGATASTDSQICHLFFDDNNYGGQRQFNLIGLAAIKTNISAKDPLTGRQTETITVNVPNAAGDAFNDSTPGVVTGSFKVSLKGTQ